MDCEFCGRTLQRRIVKVCGQNVVMGFHECDCEGARKAQEAARDAERRVKLQRAEYEFTKRLRASGIPERYMKAELTDQSKHWYNMAVSDGLYMYGEPGRGKTYAASAIGIKAIRDGKSVRFIKAHRIGDMMRLGNMDDAIQLFVNPKLLILDDIGADNVGEWANTRLRAVIDERYDSMKPTVFTSNYSFTELMRHLDQGDKTALAIMSRIGDMGKAVKVTGKDWRA